MILSLAISYGNIRQTKDIYKELNVDVGSVILQVQTDGIIYINIHSLTSDISNEFLLSAVLKG